LLSDIILISQRYNNTWKLQKKFLPLSNKFGTPFANY